MFLKRLSIKNFRCIRDLTLYINEGVNILIGENNSGKTAVIDALRICFSYGKQWRDIYVSESDFHIDKTNPGTSLGDIEFDLYFEIQDRVESGIFNDLLSEKKDGKQELELHFRYYIDEKRGIRRVRYKVWGGEKEGQSITPDLLDLFYSVHLDALRDAVQYLRPVRGNRLGELYSNIETDEKKFDLRQNGLGYNNLIYTATVLGDLKRKKELIEETYIALLIEEPEAHLHPQLQDIFFNYLNKLNKIGFQIFISSHSPTITAKADLNSLIVLQSQENKIQSFSIKKSNLNESNKKYLQKFLDVTKSQLLFANGVILVEGISEALLLPVFSKIIGDEYNIEKKGIELVNLNGVAFEHFGKLFNADVPELRLNCRCAILTDDDRHNGDEVSSRAKRAKALEKNLLKVELAEQTFEYELFIAGNNREILLQIFSEMHPIAAKKIDIGNSIEDHAKNFIEKIVSNKAKSELAHRLAIKLNDEPDARENFTVPSYIKTGIKWVVKGE